MADLNMATVMSLSGRVALVTGGGTGCMCRNFHLRLVVNSLTEDSTLLKPLLQTGQKYTSLAEGWMSWRKLLRQSQVSPGPLFRL